MCLTITAFIAFLFDSAILYALCMSLYYSGMLIYVHKVLPFFGYKAVCVNKYSTDFKVIKNKEVKDASIKEKTRIA